MEALGKDGVLVKVGRGSLMDELELVRCLRHRVHEPGLVREPAAVPPELLAMDNVVLSDHMAVIMSESMRGLLQDFITNLDAFFSGRPLVSHLQLRNKNITDNQSDDVSRNCILSLRPGQDEVDQIYVFQCNPISESTHNMGE
ncbi:hypothetical protein ACQJBY_030963 [Aegilops geniculata]